MPHAQQWRVISCLVYFSMTSTTQSSSNDSLVSFYQSTYPHSPPPFVGGGGYIAITLSICQSVRLSICPSVVLSMCPMVSTQYLLNCSTIFLKPNLVWWCIIMRQCVLWKNWFTILKYQGHSEGLYNQNMTIFTISSKLLVSLQPNLVWWYSIISWSVLWKNGITVFKVKVTENV